MKNKTPFPILICASLVSAQRRRRLFWTNIPNVTLPEDKGILLKDILEQEVDEKYFVNTDKYKKQIQVKEGSAFDYYNNKEIPDGKAKVLGTNPQSTTAIAGQLVNDNTQIRKLTPIECERLQGVPDNYTEGVSNSQRYKTLGNAFNVDVVSWILSFIPNDLSTD